MFIHLSFYNFPGTSYRPLLLEIIVIIVGLESLNWKNNVLILILHYNIYIKDNFDLPSKTTPFWEWFLSKCLITACAEDKKYLFGVHEKVTTMSLSKIHLWDNWSKIKIVGAPCTFGFQGSLDLWLQEALDLLLPEFDSERFTVKIPTSLLNYGVWSLWFGLLLRFFEMVKVNFHQHTCLLHISFPQKVAYSLLL